MAGEASLAGNLSHTVCQLDAESLPGGGGSGLTQKPAHPSAWGGSTQCGEFGHRDLFSINNKALAGVISLKRGARAPLAEEEMQTGGLPGPALPTTRMNLSSPCLRAGSPWLCVL